MASKIVVLALVLVAIIGMVSADAPKATKDSPAAGAPASNDTAGAAHNGGAAGGPKEAASAPAGGDAAAAGGSSAAEAPKSGAPALEVSAAVGVAALAGYFVV